MFNTNEECKKLDKKCYYPIKCVRNPYFYDNSYWVEPTPLENKCMTIYESADKRYLARASSYTNGEEETRKRCYFIDQKNGNSYIALPGQIILAKCKNL